MLTTIATVLGAGVAVVGTIVANVPEAEPYAVPIQYGALGILAFMIWANRDERKHMVQSIDEKDRRIEGLMTQFIEATRDLRDAAKSCKATQDQKPHS